ncbi:hypothetical protein CVT25_008301, partial [Psilocybe cyanescens]
RDGEEEEGLTAPGIGICEGFDLSVRFFNFVRPFLPILPEHALTVVPQGAIFMFLCTVSCLPAILTLSNGCVSLLPLIRRQPVHCDEHLRVDRLAGFFASPTNIGRAR